MGEKNEIYILTHKQLVNELSNQEAITLNNLLVDASILSLHEQIKSDWVQAGNANELAFDQSKAYSDFLLKANPPKVIKLASTKSNEIKVYSINWRYMFSAIAAIFIFGLLAINIFSNTGLTTHNFSDGAIVSLSDGSKVYLDNNSEITYPSDFNTREIALKGRAIFEVAKNQGSTFIVNANDTKVTVLGTTFSVNANAKSKEIKVLEGTVKVEQNKQQILIQDRESVVIGTDGTFEKHENISFSTESYYQPLLEFSNTPLPKVLSDLESQYQVTFSVLGRNDITKCLFTSKSLKNVGLADIITILSTTFNASFNETEPSVYQVSRLSCN